MSRPTNTVDDDDSRDDARPNGTLAAAQTANSGSNSGGGGSSSSSSSSSSAAGRLLSLLRDDGDLRLWLEHTGYFDVAQRERVLDGIRKLRAVDEAREKLLLELRGSAGGLFHGCPTAAPTVAATSTATATTVVDAPPCVQPSRTPSCFASSSSRTSASGGSVHGGAPDHHRPEPDTRFFLIKSASTANIYMSQKDGLWATQAKNGAALTAAFQGCRRVILFFSINKSRSFQGFARMTSAPDATIAKPQWVRKIPLTAVTQPFRVEWLNTVGTDFDDVGHLENSLNDFRSVVVGRDGQEYSPDCGHKMMALMDLAAKRPAARAPAWAPARPLRARTENPAPHKDPPGPVPAAPSWFRRARNPGALARPESVNLIDY